MEPKAGLSPPITPAFLQALSRKADSGASSQAAALHVLVCGASLVWLEAGTRLFDELLAILANTANAVFNSWAIPVEICR